jgi:hypothetical protein
LLAGDNGPSAVIYPRIVGLNSWPPAHMHGRRALSLGRLGTNLFDLWLDKQTSSRRPTKRLTRSLARTTRPWPQN